jgi:hypothetical protein
MALENKEYIFNFVGCSSGWNTVWAKTLKGARKLALKTYKDADVDTVRLADERTIALAMSLFH